MIIQRSLDISGALLAFVAAVFWFMSAYGKLPPMIPYWDRTPDTDPFYQAITFSARMNQWGALFSGLSAVCMGVRLFMK